MSDPDLKLQGEVSLDTSSAESALGRVEQQAGRMAQGLAQAGAAAGQSVAGIGAAAEKLNASQSRVVESIKRAAIGTTEGKAALLEYKAAVAGVSDAAAPYIAKIKAAETANVNMGMSAKQMAFAVRGVPAQFTDIATSLAAGQRPMMVLLQQGGQLKDMFGGLGPAARALGGYVAGLVNPITLAAAAIGGIAYAAYQGSKELTAFQNAAILSGNAIGLSNNKYAELRDSLAGIAGTKGKASEALAEIAKAGIAAGDNIKGIAQAAILMEKATGEPLQKTVAQFKKLYEEPAKASIELNKQFNYLTTGIYAQISALEASGDKAGAAALAMRTFGDASGKMAAAVTSNLGAIERSWEFVGTKAKQAWDFMLGVGRAKTGDQELAGLRAKAAELVSKGVSVSPGGPTSYAERELFVTRSRIELLERLNKVADENARAEGARVAAVAAGVAAVEAISKANEKGESATVQMNKALDAYRANLARVREEYARTPTDALKKLIDPSRVLAAERAIREQFAGRGGKAEKAWFSQADIEAAKQYESYFKKFAAIQGEAEEKSLGLTKAQGDLSAMLKDPVFQAMPETWRQSALQQAYAAVSAEQHRDAESALQKQIEASTKAFEDYAKGMRESERKGEGDILKRVSDLEWEGRTYGLLESQVARVTLARLQDARSAAALGGENVEAIERQIAAQEKLITALEGKELRKANKDAADASAKEWDRVADAFVDNLMRGGKSVAQYLKDLFRTLVLRPLLAPIGNAVAGVVGSALGMPAAAQSFGGSAAGSAAGSMFGSSLFGSSMLGTGLSTTMSNGLISGFGMNMANIGNAFAGGEMMLGLGGALPYIGTALAAISLLSGAFKGETRSGGKYTDTSFLEGPSGGEINGAASRTAIGATIESINQTLRSLGSSATLGGLQTGFESSERGKGFAYAGGTLSTGAPFGQNHGTGWQNRRGSMTAEQAAAAWGEELKQATLQALQAADVPGMLGDWLRGLGDIDALSGGALDAALGRIQKALGEKASLEDRYFELTHTQEEVLARNRQRERAALDESNRDLYDKITALEDKAGRAGAATVSLAEALDKLRNPLRTVEDIARSIFDLEREGQGLQVELLRAQGDEPAARALQRVLDTAGFTEAEIAAYDYNQALRDQIQALRDAKTAAQEHIDAIRGDTDAAYRAVERAIAAQRQSAQAAVQAASEQRNAVQAVFDALKPGIERLYGQAAPTMLASQGQAFVAQALATVKASGYLPDASDLSDAITGAMGGIETTVYESEVDRQRAQLVLAGQLSQLKTFSGDQLTVAERQLKAAEDQVESLDAMLEAARSQLDALRGIDTGVMSFKDAIDRLAAAMSREAVGTGVKLGATEQWVSTPVGQVWQSTGGAMAVQTDDGLQIAGKQTSFSGAAAQDWVNAELSIGDALAVYTRASEEGISANSLDKLMGWVDGTSNEWARNVGLPAFAVGTNRIPRDMVALLHENEAVLPPAFNPWAGGSLGGSDRLERLVEGLTAEVQRLRSQVAEVGTNTRRTADAVNGNPDAPMVVEMAE